MPDIPKSEPSPDYPPEEGCFLRGNDYSPVAVVVILRWNREKTPPEIEQLIQMSVESGAALAGSLQTENVGLEKVICNIVSNPNIRYLVVCGPESPGHFVGESIIALKTNGVDERKRIVGTRAPTPFLFNLPPGHVARFRDQITVIDLVDEAQPERIREAICACYQETPTAFRDLLLHDPGAYPAPPLSGGINWRVTRPETQPKDPEEAAQHAKIRDLVDRVRRATQARDQQAPPAPR